MLQTALLFVFVVAIVAVLMRFAMRWASDQFTRDLRAFLRAAESIIEQEKIPEPWLAPYRDHITALRQAGKSERDVERVGMQARKHCLGELDRVIYFFEKTNVTDTRATRETLLSSLRQQRARWAAAPWQALFEVADPQPEPNESRAATGLD